MSDTPALLMRYEGAGRFDATTPYWAKRADELYTVGATYYVEAEEQASKASRGHYFASLNTAWSNLPDHMLDQYPTMNHLRKKALIRAGYADEQSIVCASHAEALRVAAWAKPMDTYAVVLVRDNVVSRYTAKSQSARAMGKAEFQASKTAVLEILDNLLGTRTGELERAGAAA